MPTAKYGTSLANRISAGRTGVTNSASSVPRSHSRATTSEVRKAPTSVMMMTISPGTRYQVLVLALLNHMRGCSATAPTAAGGARLPSCASASARRTATCASAPLT